MGSPRSPRPPRPSNRPSPKGTVHVPSGPAPKHWPTCADVHVPHEVPVSQTVLAIDDSPDIHRLLDVRLRPEGLILHHALAAGEGLAMARDLKPDLILLDVDLPLVTGFEVCRQLKEDPATAEIPIIFLTGASEIYTKVQGFDLGGVDYVIKP